jgi:hypothetical protein
MSLVLSPTGQFIGVFLSKQLGLKGRTRPPEPPTELDPLLLLEE